ncbi:MAG: helix-turn-helix domain-containing protein [Holdemanella porci]
MTYIDTDLTADLSLSALSNLLNLSPNYLSALFKKEAGTTLTNYVNTKRIEHAVYLLSSTDMQIQNIAQYCGIPDVNYFTKIFKKVMNKTPSEFKEDIR